MTEINNSTWFKINKDLLIKASEIVLKEESKNVNLSIALVNSKKIKELNKEYRKKNYITDVLSFRDEQMPEIVLCLKKIKKNAKINNNPFQKEIVFCLIHGILHILGYDHEAGEVEELKMQEKENYYLSKIFS